MKKLFTFIAATLFGLNAMAADFTPTAVYTVGDESTLGTTWASKDQPQNFIVKGDTVIFNAFLCYQSQGASKQAWTGSAGNGSTDGTNEAMGCFPASSAWGTGDASKKTATTRSSRTYIYNVTNCSAVQVLIDNKATGRESYIKAYEIVEGTVSATAAATATRTDNGLGIIELDGLDLTKTYQIKVNTNTDSNSNLYAVAFISTGGTPITRYTVTYKNGETTLGTERVVEGETPVKYGDYQTVAGSAFEGWFNDAAFTSAADFTAAITADKTFYGKFTHVASSENLLKELWLSNGVKAYIVRVDSTNTATVKGCYMAGQTAPTVQSNTVSEGASFAQDGNTITVTAENGDAKAYTLELTEVTPLSTFTSGETITFDGTEVEENGYIYSVYGWDANKGIKWGKPVDDASGLRIREGRNRIYMFLPACDSVAFIGGSAGARDVEIRVNGVVNEVVKTPAKDAQILVKGFNAEAANMISFESNGKTNGDSGFTGMIIYNGSTPTSINNIETAKAIKVIENGQLYIIKNGVRYNAMGAVVE